MKVQSSHEKHKKKIRRTGNLRVNLFSTPQKKRRRNENIQKDTFIMKLFDRSLDLSKYTESTPLYPICRAWMLNQPRSQNILSYRELAKSRLDDENKVQRENNGAEMLRRITKNEMRGESLVITALPAPLNIEVPQMPKMNECYKPDLEALDKIFKREENEHESVDGSENAAKLTETKASLLADHKMKWTKIKTNYLKHARNVDKRYELNQLIIKKLFRP